MDHQQLQLQELDSISASLYRLGDHATYISDELDHQNEMLRDVTKDVDQNQETIGRVQSKLQRLLSAVESHHLLCCIILMTLVVVALFLVLIYA